MGKKIYVAYTGGTIGMQPSAQGYVPDAGFDERLHNRLGEELLATLPSFELFVYSQLIDSSNARPEHWRQIAQDIAARYELYDGFVVLHGTDTMAYSSAMVSYMLQGIKKPVIFTGSQIPLEKPRSDGLNNVIGALTLAADERLQEVCLYFDGTLLRGNRAHKVDAADFTAFASPHCPPLARLGVQVKFNHEVLLADGRPPSFNLQCDHQQRVGIILLFPGITAQWLTALFSQPVDAFILLTYGAGNGPDQDEAFLQALKAAHNNGKLLVNLSQCAKGIVHQSGYAAGSALQQAGVIDGLDHTTEAMFTKLHFLLSQQLDRETIIPLLQQPIAGEMTAHSP